jgi:hypothetical protein
LCKKQWQSLKKIGKERRNIITARALGGFYERQETASQKLH